MDLFCNGPSSFEWATTGIYPLIECAKINGINPEECLSLIFELAADTTGWTDSSWAELIP